MRPQTQAYGRGIDMNGNVANFVETEQIVAIDQFMFSYIQLRGSVPIFWSEETSYGGLIQEINTLKNEK